jgi:uncharacterized lipoprotein YddW (UPF0748 family)
MPPIDESRREFLQHCMAAGLAAAGLAQGCADQADGPGPDLAPAAEMRAVWLALYSPRDMFCDDGQVDGVPTPSGVERVIGIIAESGFNTLFLQVDSWYAYSLLHPEYEPRNPLARFDALAAILRAASLGGLQVHLNYPLVNARNNPRLPGIAPDFLTVCGGNPQWRAQYLDDTGQIVESQNNVCPSRPETREWEVDLLGRLVERYPRIARFQFEEPGYDGPTFCVCDECRRQFTAEFGGDLVAQVQAELALERCAAPACDGRAAALKCQHLTRLLQQVRNRLSPRAFLYSATISYDRWRDQRMGRDWVRWASHGWLDFVSPMIYISDTAVFRDSLERGVLAPLDREVSACTGIGLHFSGSLIPAPGQRAPNVNTVEEVVRQIETAREVGRSTGRVSGVALFLGEFLRPAFRDQGARLLAEIKAGAFAAAARVPTWESARYRAFPPGLG